MANTTLNFHFDYRHTSLTLTPAPNKLYRYIWKSALFCLSLVRLDGLPCIRSIHAHDDIHEVLMLVMLKMLTLCQVGCLTLSSQPPESPLLSARLCWPKPKSAMIMTRMKRTTMIMKGCRGPMMMVMMTWSNIAKSGNAPLSPSCVNIDLGRFQIKREIDIYGPTKSKLIILNSKWYWLTPLQITAVVKKIATTKTKTISFEKFTKKWVKSQRLLMKYFRNYFKNPKKQTLRDQIQNHFSGSEDGQTNQALDTMRRWGWRKIFY